MDGDTYNIHFAGLRTAIRNSEMSMAAKALVLNLLLYAGQNGNCFPSETTLANDFGISDRYIRELLTELNSFHLLRWRRGKPGRSNSYTLSPDIYLLKSRNNSSIKTGSTVPIQTGTIVPTKVISESNQINSSHLLQLFEATAKRTSNRTEIRRLTELSRQHPESWIKDALNIISTRNLPYVQVGLVENIIGDWVRDGKPEAKPVFTPCGLNGCNHGSIFQPENQTYLICNCKNDYDNKLKLWRKNNPMN